jgi:hypothetical protein
VETPIRRIVGLSAHPDPDRIEILPAPKQITEKLTVTVKAAPQEEVDRLLELPNDDLAVIAFGVVFGLAGSSRTILARY